MLAPGFVVHTPGAAPTPVADFLAGIRALPTGIVFVRLEHLEVDVQGDPALATGVQHARVGVAGQLVDDRRPFVDWFVKLNGAWKLRVALDLPSLAEPALKRSPPA